MQELVDLLAPSSGFSRIKIKDPADFQHHASADCTSFDTFRGPYLIFHRGPGVYLHTFAPSLAGLWDFPRCVVEISTWKDPRTFGTNPHQDLPVCQSPNSHYSAGCPECTRYRIPFAANENGENVPFLYIPLRQTRAPFGAR